MTREERAMIDLVRQLVRSVWEGTYRWDDPESGFMEIYRGQHFGTAEPTVQPTARPEEDTLMYPPRSEEVE